MPERLPRKYTREMRGKDTLAVEVTHASPLGLWMLIQDVEHYLPYTEFLWFKQATIEQSGGIGHE
jgi:hypothetical protein